MTTEVMPDFRALWRQRMRWERGTLENIGAYGLTRATLRYWLQQIGMGYGTVALNAYFLPLALTLLAADGLRFAPFWVAIGMIVVIVRVVTVWPVGRRGRLLAAPLVIEIAYDLMLQAVFVQVPDRYLHRAKRRLELRPATGGGSAMTFLIGGILFSSDLLTSPFFQALATFVAINTLVYAGLSIAKIFPRKRE